MVKVSLRYGADVVMRHVHIIILPILLCAQSWNGLSYISNGPHVNRQGSNQLLLMQTSHSLTSTDRGSFD